MYLISGLIHILFIIYYNKLIVCSCLIYLHTLLQLQINPKEYLTAPLSYNWSVLNITRVCFNYSMFRFIHSFLNVCQNSFYYSFLNVCQNNFSCCTTYLYISIFCPCFSLFRILHSLICCIRKRLRLFSCIQ